MARRKEPAPVCCSHWRVVTSGQLQMVASRSRVSGSIRRRGFFNVSARGPLPRRFARSFRRTPAGERSIRCCAVEKRANVPTILWSSTLAYKSQLERVHVHGGESPAGRCPCCGHRRVSHRSGGSGPSSGAMVRSHARRGRRTAPRIRRRAREIRAKHATSGFPRRHLLQIPPPQFRRDW